MGNDCIILNYLCMMPNFCKFYHVYHFLSFFCCLNCQTAHSMLQKAYMYGRRKLEGSPPHFFPKIVTTWGKYVKLNYGHSPKPPKKVWNGTYLFRSLWLVMWNGVFFPIPVLQRVLDVPYNLCVFLHLMLYFAKI